MLKRVLIADDSPKARRGLSVCFETIPDWIVVGEATDGNQAIDLCDQLQPDLVVMDLHMPVMDGVMAVSYLLLQHPHIRILVLTSSFLEDDRQAAFAAGAHGFITKYASLDEIEAALHQTMND